jgi:hypothetical protein
MIVHGHDEHELHHDVCHDENRGGRVIKKREYPYIVF